ncbi:hypothetical protein IFR05_009170 [Cadophora sp. M221]|nr:hypothetical protein IFR05_009170 [Cadophora sp. M221]
MSSRPRSKAASLKGGGNKGKVRKAKAGDTTKAVASNENGGEGGGEGGATGWGQAVVGRGGQRQRDKKW